jgi:hypothetical protein
VEPIIQGIPGAISDDVASYDYAVALYTMAYNMGHVCRVVRVGGVYDDQHPHPSLSGGSSIWDEVSDIGDVAAQWSG